MTGSPPSAGSGSGTDPGRIKGAAFREFVGWWETTYGAESVPRELGALCPHVPNASEFLAVDRPALGILASAWYPAALVHGVVDALVGDLPESQWDAVAMQAAPAIMQTNFHGVYKAVFGLLISPDRYIKLAQRLWSMHYDTGTAMIVRDGDFAHRSTNRDWHGHHPFICRLNAQASLALYGAMGCRDIQIERLSCVSHGASGCETRVQWTRK